MSNSANIVHVKGNDEFKTQVLDSDIPVLVDFWAEWCGPCKMIAPVLERLLDDQDLKGKFKVAKVDVDAPENKELAMQYQIMSIPNMKFFAEGKWVEGKDIIGFAPDPVMKPQIQQVLAGLPQPQSA